MIELSRIHFHRQIVRLVDIFTDGKSIRKILRSQSGDSKKYLTNKIVNIIVPELGDLFS